ncbi:MAG: hypothetical protein LC109_15025 [Bacteroidia bacterium]|nr:hypothetical protein [Bacteroidia bacterium]MCO5254012.1 hypothetical protein [Bacteroidota bacterium]MCZ2131565.1 hypothetical protein [Bacteroidia bacterium]
MINKYNAWDSGKRIIILFLIAISVSSCYMKKRVYNRGFHFERLTSKDMNPTQSQQFLQNKTTQQK